MRRTCAIRGLPAAWWQLLHGRVWGQKLEALGRCRHTMLVSWSRGWMRAQTASRPGSSSWASSTSSRARASGCPSALLSQVQLLPLLWYDVNGPGMAATARCHVLGGAERRFVCLRLGLPAAVGRACAGMAGWTREAAINLFVVQCCSGGPSNLLPQHTVRRCGWPEPEKQPVCCVWDNRVSGAACLHKVGNWVSEGLVLQDPWWVQSWRPCWPC